MAKNILVINVDIRETRVALIENGIIAELHVEREGARGTLGNIYLGKVSRVLPGMQAAFIDIGQERAAFLHVEDLIRPDDFEAYLSGHRHGGKSSSEEESREEATDAEEVEAAGEDAPAEDEAPAEDADIEVEEVELEVAADDEIYDAEEPAADSDEDVAAEPAEDEPEEEDAAQDEPAEEAEMTPDDDDDEEIFVAGEASVDEGDDEQGPVSAREANVELMETKLDATRAAEEPDAADDEEDVEPETLEVAASAQDAEAPAEGAAMSAEEEAGLKAPRARTRRGGRGRRRRGKTRPDGSPDEQPAQAAAPAPRAPAPPPPREPTEQRGRGRGQQPRQPREAQQQGGRGRQRGAEGDRRSRSRDGRRPNDRRGGPPAGRTSRAKDPLRVSKSTPIRDVVREGQEVVVQVSKEPIGTKGARVTSHISLPGRYVVYLPTVEHIGISKRIGSDKERGRLREAIEAMKPPQGGLIVRTLAEGLTKKSLKADVGYLVRLWGEIASRRETTERAPATLFAELDLVLKTARDLFTDDVEKIVIDSREEYVRLKRFVEMFMPERAAAIELYEGEEPIFDAYGIEDEIGRALSRKVPLNSGGHLIIDQAEALTAIDVNTGRFVGRGSKDLEDTILQTNLEAVEEIAYQLRFRNIGGLIILDLIDMERISNREKVRRKLETLLAKDKAKTTLNRISDLGLIEMTRKRTRESLGRIMNEPCFYCDGTGNLQSRQTIAYEILRQIKRERMSLRGYSVVVNAHPAVIDFLKNEERGAVIEAEKRYQRRLELVARKEYHLEQFDLAGK